MMSLTPPAASKHRPRLQSEPPYENAWASASDGEGEVGLKSKPEGDLQLDEDFEEKQLNSEEVSPREQATKT